MTKHRYDWVRQAKDPRDYPFRPRRLTSLSSKVDLSGGMGPLLDQGQEGSCGPNTAAEAINYDQKVQGLSVQLVSRNFIYYNTRVIMGTVGSDSGVDNRSMMQSLAQYGDCPESLWPYDTSNFTAKPSAVCYTTGAANAIKNYAAVVKSLSVMKAAIAGGFPFLFGFDVFQQIESDQAAATGVVADPSGSPIGGHDVLFVGYDDAGFGKIPGGAFKFRNHWTNADGSPWGDGGYGYISYVYATGTSADDFWVINSIPGAVVPPTPPTPTPTPTPVPIPDSPAFSMNFRTPVPANRLAYGLIEGPLAAGIYDAYLRASKPTAGDFRGSNPLYTGK